jgi:hypothetical protein
MFNDLTLLLPLSTRREPLPAAKAAAPLAEEDLLSSAVAVDRRSPSLTAHH